MPRGGSGRGAPGTATWRPPGLGPGRRPRRLGGPAPQGWEHKEPRTGTRHPAPHFQAALGAGCGLEGRWQLVARAMLPCGPAPGPPGIPAGGVPGPEGSLPALRPRGETRADWSARSPERGRVAAPVLLRQRREGGGTHFPFLFSLARCNPSSLTGPCQLFLEPFTRQLKDRPLYSFVWTPPFPFSGT